MKLKKTNKKNILKIVSIFMLVGIILARISYAVYQRVDEVLFINARVGNFEKNNSDIELAIKLDGEEVENPPSKDNYVVTVECDYADGRWDTEEWGVMITNIGANKVKCNVNFKTPEPSISEVTATSTKTSISLSYEAEGIGTRTICKYGTEEGNYSNTIEDATNTNCTIENLEMETEYYYQVCAKNNGGEVCKDGSIKTKPEIQPISVVEIGEYISMTPTSTSYTMSSSLTGNGANQTINPSELNLWRVIKKNEDGTVDVVSEYVSSTIVSFYGQTGFLKYVGGLNTISTQYTNDKYVAKTRHMGYNNQLLTCSSVSSCPADTGYQTDTNLVQKAIGTLIGKNLKGAVSNYHLPSRYVFSQNRFTYYNIWYINTSGVPVSNSMLWSTEGGAGGSNFSIRPILTLKADIQINSGDGKSADTAYIFE